MVQATLAAIRIIGGESSLEGKPEFKLVEMNRTIMDSCSSKRDRRSKAQNSVFDSPPRTNRKVQTHRDVEGVETHYLKKLISQDVKISDRLDLITNKVQIAQEKPNKSQSPSKRQKKLKNEFEGCSNEGAIQIDDDLMTIPLQPMQSMQLEEISVVIEEPKYHRLEMLELESNLAFSDIQHKFRHPNPQKEGKMTTSRFEDDLADTCSLNCRSETNNTVFMVSLEDYFNNLANKLFQISKDSSAYKKEHVYREVHRFIKNLLRFELDSELLVKRKIGKYLSTIYGLLRQVNDLASETYIGLLKDASSLVGLVKQQLLTFVRQTDSSTNLAIKSQYSISTASLQTR